MSKKEIQTRVATCGIVEEGILLYHIHERTDLTLEDLQEGRAANAELSGGHDYCLLVKGGLFTSYSNEALEVQRTEAYTKGRIAMALLVSNAALEIMAKLFLRLNKPLGATKIFKDEEKAIAWLRLKYNEHNKISA